MSVYIFFRILLLSLILSTSYVLLNWSYDDDNKIYGQEERQNNNTVKTHIITIPKGSANPSIDITDLEVRKWYIPPKLEIEDGDVVKWINNDSESHTVTSGVGSGIQSLLTNKLGTANGLFDSGLFPPGRSWSYNFTNKIGMFTYFCTLHPWMTAMVEVKESKKLKEQQQEEEKEENKFNSIPNYPVDEKGNNLSQFPVHTLSNDEKYDIDMSWSPKTLKTNEPSTFLLNFFEMPSNKKLYLLPFDFEISQ